MKRDINTSDGEISIWSGDEINDDHENEVLIFVSDGSVQPAQCAYANTDELINILQEIKQHIKEGGPK